MYAFINVETNPGPTVTLPDMRTIAAMEKGQLPLSSKLLTQAKKASVLNDLHSSSLISFGKLCDDKYKVILDKRNCYVMKDEYLILQEKRNLTGGLWNIALPAQNKYMVPQHSKYKNFSLFRPIP